MILPKTTYRVIEKLPMAAPANTLLSKGTVFEISVWANPNDQIIPITLLNAAADDRQTNTSPFMVARADIEAHCALTTDFGKAIYFYSATDAYGDFSNFSAHGIEHEGKFYPTVEHFYQAHKFKNKTFAEQIRMAKSPKEASILGKSRAEPLVENWNVLRNDVMQRATQLKFETHQDLRKRLLETEDALLIESSPYDYYWGIGTNGDGANHLGTTLMRIRMQLK